MFIFEWRWLYFFYLSLSLSFLGAILVKKNVRNVLASFGFLHPHELLVFYLVFKQIYANLLEVEKLTWKYCTPSPAPPSASTVSASVSPCLLSFVLFVWLLIRSEQINERFKC